MVSRVRRLATTAPLVGVPLDDEKNERSGSEYMGWATMGLSLRPAVMQERKQVTNFSRAERVEQAGGHGRDFALANLLHVAAAPQSQWQVL